MRIADVDLSATTGSSPLHRMSPVAKLVAFALVLASVLANNNFLVLFAVAMTLLVPVVAFRLPAKPILALAAYPAFFAAVFALASAADASQLLTFVAKAATAALGALLLVFTTPYPQLFAPLQRVVGQVVGDSFLLTYRSLFLMAEKFGELLRAVRLRSGLSRGQPVRAARAMALSLGGLMLYSFDLSQRTYDVMRLRGYERRLKASRPARVSRPLDALAILAAAALAAVALLWRYEWPALNPFSWAPPLGAALLLAAGGAYRWRTS
jgi:energy-coupling factor transporter transmembrane protein EcfT